MEADTSPCRAVPMPAWAAEHFKNPSVWKPIVRRHSLAMCVIAVAQTRVEGAWSAYIDRVPGEDHALEMQQVLDCGDKLAEKIARVLFPEFDGVPYAR